MKEDIEAVKISFFSIVVLKSAIIEKYRGGEISFMNDFPCSVQSEHLYRLCVMSGSELEESVLKLENNGLSRETSIAIGEMIHGKLEGSQDILFTNMNPNGLVPRWFARRRNSDDKPIQDNQNTPYT